MCSCAACVLTVHAFRSTEMYRGSEAALLAENPWGSTKMYTGSGNCPRSGHRTCEQRCSSTKGRATKLREQSYTSTGALLHQYTGSTTEEHGQHHKSTLAVRQKHTGSTTNSQGEVTGGAGAGRAQHERQRTRTRGRSLLTLEQLAASFYQTAPPPALRLRCFLVPPHQGLQRVFAWGLGEGG